MKTDKNSKKNSALVTATLTSFLTPFMGSSINIAIPAIRDTFKTNAIMSSVETGSYVIASGGGTMRLVGMMTSMGVAALIFALYVGRVEITSQNHHFFLKGMKSALIIFFILSCGGMAASLVSGTLRGAGEINP